MIQRAASDRDHPHGRTVALRGVMRSLLINIVCTYLLYESLAPHFRPGSPAPLGTAAAPLFGIVYVVMRQRSIDVIALLAIVDVAVGVISAGVTQTATLALAGRSLESAALSIIVLCSLFFRKPIMFHAARQFVTGQDPDAITGFDCLATQPEAVRVYRVMTAVWAVVLLVGSAVSILLALSVCPGTFLAFSPILSYGAIALLTGWSLRYGNAKLGNIRSSAQEQRESRYASRTKPQG